MSQTVIKVENLYKEYKLGVISHGTLSHDLQSWWARMRGKEDPNSLISAHHNADAEKESFLALKDVSFEIKQGDRVGIIGKNGAGKSTLLKILSKITSPTSGQIKIKGRIAALLEVGTGFHQELTGRENIYLNGAILGMSRKEIDHKLDEIVDFAGIEKHIDTPVKRYSSGMNVRLGFAVAAHLEPEILIVDEVLAVGDAEFQKKALGKMEAVSKGEGRTILFVSHNMAAVQQLCQKGIILSNGQLLYTGTATESVDKYINLSDRKVVYQDNGYIELEEFREKIYKEKIFKRIRILNKDNLQSEDFPMLSSMIIEVELENTEKYRDADYGIIFSTKTGFRVTSLATWMVKKNEIIKSPTKIQLKIPLIKFSSGTYYISLSSTYHSSGEWIDKIENAVTFNVEQTDVFNTGRVFNSDYGVFLLDGTMICL